MADAASIRVKRDGPARSAASRLGAAAEGEAEGPAAAGGAAADGGVASSHARGREVDICVRGE